MKQSKKPDAFSWACLMLLTSEKRKACRDVFPGEKKTKQAFQLLGSWEFYLGFTAELSHSPSSTPDLFKTLKLGLSRHRHLHFPAQSHFSFDFHAYREFCRDS